MNLNYIFGMATLTTLGCSGKVHTTTPCNTRDYGIYETSSGKMYEFQDAIAERAGPEVLVVDGREIITDPTIVEDVYFLANWAWQVPNVRAQQTIEWRMDGLVESLSD